MTAGVYPRLVDAQQEHGVRSPLLDALDLDSSNAAFERAIGAWHDLAEAEADTSVLPPFTLDAVMHDYLNQPYAAVTAVAQYIHAPEFRDCMRYRKPTHLKQPLATSCPNPFVDDLGYRLLQHEYDSDRAMRGNIASLLEQKHPWTDSNVTDPFYIYRPHNHGQSFVSYFRRGGMRLTEWRFPDGTLPEVSISTRKEDWQQIVSRLVRREVTYQAGDVMWLHADEVHAVREVEGETVTLIAEMPTPRRHSVTFDEPADGGLAPRGVFATRGLARIAWEREPEASLLR